MDRTLDRGVFVGIGLIAALLVAAAAINYRNTRQLNEDAGWATHARVVLDLTTDVLLTVVDAETGERGFLLSSGRDEFLQPYHAAVARLNERLAALKAETADDAPFQERVRALEELTAARLATLKESIDARRKNEPRVRVYVQLINKGKEQMDGIRAAVAAMQAEQRNNLAERQRQTLTSYRVAVTTGLATALLGLVTVGALAWLLNRSLRTRDQAAAAVREQREWFRTTLSSIADAVIATDTEGKVAFLNGVAATLTGWTPDAAQGRPLGEVFRLIDEHARGEAENPALKALREGRSGHPSRHSLLVAKDGAERPVESGAAPILDDKDLVAGAVLTFRDITERRRLERELQARADELADADRRKNEFLAMLAHELRNPLAPIRSGLQVLRLSDDRGVRERSQEMMGRQLSHMVRLIDDLLDVSRISRGRMGLRRARVTLADAVHNAVEAARPLVEEVGHELVVSLPPGPVTLDADLTRLAQVFSNLLANSAKYTPPGGRIWLSAEADGDAVTVTVRDTGIGIPADALPTVFDMFSQVDRSAGRSAGGLGIGLALVRGLVEMHGGTVTAASGGDGQGSTFTVRLPTVADAPRAEPAPPAPEGERTGAPARRVLVVDDNRDAAASMATMLRLLGNDVATAHDGVEAVEAAERFRPEVVLMDLGMPRLNGLDATRRIRERPWGREMAVVALTGWGQDGDRARSKEAGCDGHLVKPVDLDELQAVLRQLGGRAQAV